MYLSFLLGILLVSNNSFASSVPAKRESKTIQYQLGFSKLIVEDDINVVLVESTLKQMDVLGSEKELQSFTWSVKDGAMTISSKKRNHGEKITVTLYVQGLKELNVLGSSIISSLGHLKTPLAVHLKDEACVALSSKESITVFRDYQIELNVKNQTGKVNVY